MIIAHRDYQVHLPRLGFPSQPSKFYLEDGPQVPSETKRDARETGEGADGDGDVTMGGDDDESDADDDKDADADEESIRLWVGSVAEGHEQRQIRLARFESCRLGQFAALSDLSMSLGWSSYIAYGRMNTQTSFCRTNLGTCSTRADR